MNRFEEQGLIKCFEYTHEVAWNVMKDFLTEECILNLYGSKSSTREAFNKGLIIDGQVWMDMIESRNQSVHAYNIETADKLVSDITDKYNEALKSFCEKMVSLL